MLKYPKTQGVAVVEEETENQVAAEEIAIRAARIREESVRAIFLKVTTRAIEGANVEKAISFS